MGWGSMMPAGRQSMLCGAGAFILAAGTLRQIPAPAGWIWPERTRDITGSWSDLFNFLDLVPGPAFLLIFMVYAAVVIAVGWLLRNWLLDTMSSPAMLNESGRLPFPLKPSFLDVAYLRGGRDGMIAVAMCNLVRLGVVSPLLERLPPTYTPKALQGQPRELCDLERAICNALERKVELRQLHRDSLVAREVSLAESKAKAKLDALGFGSAATAKRTALAVTAAALLLIDGVAIIRLLRSYLRGYHNIELLVLIALAATAVAWKVLIDVQEHRVGGRFLRRLQSDAAGVIRRMQAMNKPGDNADVIYAIAACGAVAVQGTVYEDAYQQTVPRPVCLAGSSNSSDSLTSSCSSCSGGSCGGGGCGGGGCGGGGCGGG